MSSKKAAGTKEDGKPALVPRLRFPEFRKDGEWEEKRLGELVKVASGQVDPTQLPYRDSLQIGSENIESHTGKLLNLKTAGGKGVISGNYAFDEGDVLYSKIRPALNKVAAPAFNGICSADIYPIRPANGDLLQGYLLYVLLSKRFLEYAIRNSERGKIPKINRDALLAYATLIPSPAEQHRIASCLSSVDEVIAAQARKVDALKTHKKGLMQQLFPREGETQPRLRFPEFQDVNGWEEQKLEDLAKRGSGHTPSKSRPEYYNGNIKWVSLADSKRLDAGLISKTTIEISEQGIENSSAVLHPAGTVFISRDAGIGKSAVMAVPMAVSQHFIAWVCKPGKLSNWFLYHLLQNAKPLFERAATGSTIKTIGLQFFVDLVFRIPSLPEQRRIASCLTILDALITSETQKFEVLKRHKRGLMQQLFPSPEEVET